MADAYAEVSTEALHEEKDHETREEDINGEEQENIKFMVEKTKDMVDSEYGVLSLEDDGVSFECIEDESREATRPVSINSVELYANVKYTILI